MFDLAAALDDWDDDGPPVPFEAELTARCGVLFHLTGGPPRPIEFEPLSEYAQNPVGFCRDVLGVNLWAIQAQIAESVRDRPRTAVAACYSSGKTFLAACLSLWWLYTRRPAMVITTAPTGRQVKILLWRELRKLHRRAKRTLAGRPLQLLLQLSDDWFAMGFSSDRPASVAGAHEKNVLFLEDEAAGMDPDVVEGFSGITTTAGSRHLKIGNPISTDGPYFEAFHRDQRAWSLVNIDAQETPNYLAGKAKAEAAGWKRGDPVPDDGRFDVEVVPNLVSWSWVEAARARWTEKSPHWITKVTGKFYLQAGEKVCPQPWIIEAQQRWRFLTDLQAMTPRPPRRKLGVDIGITHDETVCCLGVGDLFRVTRAFQGAGRTDYVADQVADEILAQDVQIANIDTTGIGHGVWSNLVRKQEEGSLPPPARLTIHPVQFASKPAEPLLYRRFIDELYWQARTRLDPESSNPIAIDPEDAVLAEELGLRDFKLEDGRVWVTPKKEVKARYGKSPDRADALVICLYEPWRLILV